MVIALGYAIARCRIIRSRRSSKRCTKRNAVTPVMVVRPAQLARFFLVALNAPAFSQA